jgi:protein-tyrosine phosphatase
VTRPTSAAADYAGNSWSGRRWCSRRPGASAALHRTFTLRQFGRLAEAADAATDPAEDAATDPADGPLRAAVRAAARARGWLQPATPEADDLVDPIGGTAADFRRCAEEIERSLRPLAALIGTAG